MKKLSTITLVLAGVLSGSVHAAAPMMLNSISYQVTEQQWVKTKEAVAIIAINATVSDQNIASLRQSMMTNLQTIAAGNWHITQFNRDKTSSGLESVNARAQIRLPATQLDQINARVKNVSKAGQTYTVADLNFNPSPSDITTTQSALREEIYSDVQTELDNLNKRFPKENYFVHQVRFMSGQITPRAVGLVRVATKVAPSVSQQVRLTADVVLSSKIKDSSDTNSAADDS